jgi:Sulfotransferase domain
MSNHDAIPDFVIGGAPRSGTTFLCEVLAKHPKVYVARPFIPEPKVCLSDHPAGDSGLLQRYAEYFSVAPAGTVKVEKTSRYFENDEARQRLRRLLPRAKFIFILREPVARAYSNWLWSRRNGLETLPFSVATEQEVDRASPFPPERADVKPFDYMKRGRYGTLAKAWVDAVGRERISFHLFEHATGHPEKFVQELQSFLGVERLPWHRLRTGLINATEPDPSGLDSRLEAKLRGQIAPEVYHLAQVTGLDVSVWGY